METMWPGKGECESSRQIITGLLNKKYSVLFVTYPRSRIKRQYLQKDDIQFGWYKELHNIWICSKMSILPHKAGCFSHPEELERKQILTSPWRVFMHQEKSTFPITFNKSFNYENLLPEKFLAQCLMTPIKCSVDISYNCYLQ